MQSTLILLEHFKYFYKDVRLECGQIAFWSKSRRHQNTLHRVRKALELSWKIVVSASFWSKSKRFLPHGCVPEFRSWSCKRAFASFIVVGVLVTPKAQHVLWLPRGCHPERFFQQATERRRSLSQSALSDQHSEHSWAGKERHSQAPNNAAWYLLLLQWKKMWHNLQMLLCPNSYKFPYPRQQLAALSYHQNLWSYLRTSVRVACLPMVHQKSWKKLHMVSQQLIYAESSSLIFMFLGKDG